jgi:hypothetical protein
MPSQRELRRAAKHLLALEGRLKQARHVNRPDFLRTHSLARAESADAVAAQTLVETLKSRFPHPATLAAPRDADFTTVLDVATAGVTVLARVPGLDASLARAARAAAREVRTELAEPGGRKSGTLRSLTSEVYLARAARDVAAEMRRAAGAERGAVVRTDASGAATRR